MFQMTSSTLFSLTCSPSEMHVGSGRRNPLHVDYMFLGICMGYIQDAFTEAILTNTSVDLRLRISIVRALGKLIWIQNDLLARWHINEENIGANSKPSSTYAASSVSAAASPVQHPQYHARGNSPQLKPCSLDGQSSGTAYSRNTSDTASYASGNKTSLGRNRENLEDYSLGGSCPFSGFAMDNQRAGLGWPLSNGRSSSERPSSRQRGWL